MFEYCMCCKIEKKKSVPIQGAQSNEIEIFYYEKSKDGFACKTVTHARTPFWNIRKSRLLGTGHGISLVIT
jgi:hypothetical protein